MCGSLAWSVIGFHEGEESPVCVCTCTPPLCAPTYFFGSCVKTSIQLLALPAVLSLNGSLSTVKAEILGWPRLKDKLSLERLAVSWQGSKLRSDWQSIPLGAFRIRCSGNAAVEPLQSVIARSQHDSNFGWRTEDKKCWDKLRCFTTLGSDIAIRTLDHANRHLRRRLRQ
jgi:hypothetical protein